MQVLLVLQILLVVGLVATILVQKTSSDGFTGASSPSAFLTGRAQANLFTRITSIFATLFLINSLVLAYMSSHTERGISILKNVTEASSETKSDKKDDKNILKSAPKSKEVSDKVKSIADEIETKTQEIKEDIKNANEKVEKEAKPLIKLVEPESEQKAPENKEKTKSSLVPISE